MSDTITREQFASAVAAAISSVHHLYREVGRVMSRLRERLGEGPDALHFIGGTLAKPGRDQNWLIIRNEYAALFTSADGEENEGDDDEEELDDEGDNADVVVTKRKRTPVEIAAEQPLFVVRIVMYDPQKRDSIEPTVQYAALSGWTIGKGAWNPEQSFVLRRNMLRRIPKSLSSGSSFPEGERLITKALVTNVVGAKLGKDRRLGCSLPKGAANVPLYTLDSAEALDQLVLRMKGMWSEVVKDA